MTELRWLTRKHVSSVTGAVFMVEKVLQYRNFINDSWSEWQDVPTVEETDDSR